MREKLPVCEYVLHPEADEELVEQFVIMRQLARDLAFAATAKSND